MRQGLIDASASWRSWPDWQVRARPGVLGGDKPDDGGGGRRLSPAPRGIEGLIGVMISKTVAKSGVATFLSNTMISKVAASLRASPADELGWALGPSMIHTTLAEIEGLVRAAVLIWMPFR